MPLRHFTTPPVEATARTNPGLAPELVEKSARSSRVKPSETKMEIGSNAEKPKRRFLPQPVETSTRSNRVADKIDSEKTDCEPVDDKPKRRFLPQPVETSTRSNRADHKQEFPTPDEKPKRRFLPQPVETSTRSHRGNGKHEEQGRPTRDEKPKPRFLPQLVETSVRNSKVALGPAGEPTPAQSRTLAEDNDKEIPTPRRRFAPELIETSKRSKRAGDTRPATLPTDKTDITPGTDHIYAPKKKLRRPRPFPTPPANTPSCSTVDVPQIPPQLPRRQGSMRPHTNTRRSTRQDSFQPALEPIISVENSEDDDGDTTEGEDDGSSTPSLVGSFGSSDDSIMRLQLARTRESCDDRFSGYLLALAAKAAEKQIREQALAAFPNSDYHEIVEHFYNRDSEGDSDDGEVVGIGMSSDDETQHVERVRRRSSDGSGWAADEMQRHQEKLQQQRTNDIHEKVAAQANSSTFNDPFWTNGMTSKQAEVAVGGTKTGIGRVKEVDRMRNAASPPMLGADLKFRLCPSPKATKFETDQRMDVMPNRRDDGGGLWGGYCVADTEAQFLTPLAHRPDMITTPTVERQDPFATAFGVERPPSRPGSSRSSKGVQMLAGIEERLKAQAESSKLEAAFEEEFDDSFVTQVYNYLSLGYPALARSYDEELSKISKISTEELRRDDAQLTAKGHVGIQNGPDKMSTVLNGRCARWKALNVYIREWARQHPVIEGDAEGPGAWGVRARRGSWAI